VLGEPPTLPEKKKLLAKFGFKLNGQKWPFFDSAATPPWQEWSFLNTLNSYILKN
jgi:hypothetical protein